MKLKSYDQFNEGIKDIFYPPIGPEVEGQILSLNNSDAFKKHGITLSKINIDIKDKLFNTSHFKQSIGSYPKIPLINKTNPKSLLAFKINYKKNLSGAYEEPMFGPMRFDTRDEKLLIKRSKSQGNEGYRYTIYD